MHVSSKLVSYAVAIFAGGVAIGWAATADHYDRKIKALEDLLERAEDDAHEARLLWSNPMGVLDEVETTEDGLVATGRIIRVQGDDDPNFGSFAPPSAYVGDGDQHPDKVLPMERREREKAQALERRTLTKGDISREEPGGSIPDTPEAGEVSEEDDEEEGIIPEGETPEETRGKLQSLIDRYTADPETVEQFTEIGHKEIQGINHQPFVISRDQYAWDEEGQAYDKETLTYYPKHRVLLDEDDEVIDDVRGVVGWPSLNRFGDESEDKDTVFVRNRKLNTDYEVVRDDDSPLPLHVKYGMPREEFETTKAAGLLRLREEDL